MFGLTAEQLWMGIGFLGEALFGMRFVIQWVASERRKRSVVPVAFWYLSIVGAVIVLCYAIYREDPVFILGTGAPLLIYLRNLWFIRREPAGAAPEA